MRITYIIAIALITCAHAHAQPQTILVGGAVNGGIGVESANLPVYATSVECGMFESGSSSFGSVDGRMVLPMFFGPTVGVDARLRITINSARLTASPTVPTTIRNTVGDGLVTLDREFRIDRTTIAVGLDLLARASFGRFVLAGGASIGDRVSATIEQTDNVLGPDPHRFPDGQSSRVMAMDKQETAAISIAPMIAASYAIPMSANVVIAPELGVRFDLLSSVSDGSWRSVELALGAAIMFDLTPPPTPIDAGPDGN